MKGVYFSKIKEVSKDDRRTILDVFNGDFTDKHMKIIEIKKGNILGGHYFKHRAIRYLMKGEVDYQFHNILTNEKDRFIMSEGEILLTDPYVVHTATFLKDSIIVEGEEAPFIPGGENGIKYNEMQT